MRILLPRAPGRASALAAMIVDAGGEAVVAPLISRAPIDDVQRDELARAMSALSRGEMSWVAVTSVNALDEMVTWARGVNGSDAPTPGGERAGRAPADRAGSPDGAVSADDRAPGPLAPYASRARWAAVGPATERALLAAGARPELVATENSAAGMLAQWPSVPATPTDGDDDGRADTARPRVLLPLGDLAQPTLELGLTDLGYDPVRVTTYRTVAHAAPARLVAEWRAGQIDAAVLTSGSVAREVAEQLGVREDVTVVAIGEPTRRAAEALGQPVAAVAAAATDQAMLDALLDAVSTLSQGSSAPSPHSTPAPSLRRATRQPLLHTTRPDPTPPARPAL